jgi:hypothetical protein
MIGDTIENNIRAVGCKKLRQVEVSDNGGRPQIIGRKVKNKINLKIYCKIYEYT